MGLASFDNAMRAVFLDPKFEAQVEWFREYGLAAQLERLSVTLYEPPDFDWWEPRYDQPGRREQTRRRVMGVL